FFFLCSFHYLFVHSFPTRRSSDLFPHSALSQTSLLDACTDAEYYAKSDMCGYPNEARMENQQSPPDGPASSLYISPDPEYHLHFVPACQCAPLFLFCYPLSKLSYLYFFVYFFFSSIFIFLTP